MIIALETIARSSLVLVVLLVALRVLRGQPAALRHSILAAGLLLAAAQPALHQLIPGWTLPSTATQVVTVRPPEGSAPPPEMRFEVIKPGESPAPASSPVSSPLRPWLLVWAAGTVVGFAAMLIGVAWLLYQGSRATIAPDVWTRAAEAMRLRLGLRRPVRILITEHPALLVTWGMVRPVILLPADAASWSTDRMQTVVAHELAHVARGDWPVQMLAEASRAINWFNPLFWMVCARLRRESEHACDDAVLDLGINGTAYAAQLVELARAFRAHGRTWLPAPSMARPSTLERRVRAMLNPQVNRGHVSLTRRASLVAIMFAIALPIAAATQPAAGANGSVMDPSGLPLPDAVVRLAPVGGGAPFETRTDASGSFEFSSTPAGEYMLSVRLMGFSTTRERVRIAGPVAFKLTMQVGTLQETITVTGGPGSDAGPRTERAARPQPAAPTCGATSVGGNLRPPMKLTDVRPRYRQEWLQSGVEGNVLLQARIGTDGRVKSVEVISPVNPELEDEALAAVTQWEFSPTYLNCEAVEVRMFVTVSFKAGL